VKNGVASNITTYATTETANNAITWVKAQPNNKPFFLWLAFNAPHTPYHAPPANLHSYGNLSGTSADIAANPKNYFKAAVEALDHEIGRLFDSLQIMGKWENTDFVFIGDNGDESNVAQNKGGAKGSVYQEGISVPFIISGPSVVNPNRASDALVNTTDLFATILELFGYSNWVKEIPVNKPVDSKSILPILKNQATDIRSWVFTEVFKKPTVASDGKAIRNKTYKLLNFDNGAQQFYRIASDPTEDTDLLKATLSAEALYNYNELCTIMTNLIGKSGFCSQTTPTKDMVEVIKNLRIYPNPVTDYLKVEQAHGDESFRIFNSLGQVLFSGKGVEQQNLSALSSGVYYLEIIAHDKVVLRFVKQ
jgi:arylsulfatase A-like enzyme